MNDRLDEADVGVSRESRKRRSNHRCSGNLSILLRHVAAGPLATASRNDHSRDHSHRELLPFLSPSSLIAVLP
jgi:hypothetical protein